MKNKKVIGLLLSLTLVLGLALPGTLATSTDVAGSNGEFSLGVTEEKTEPLGDDKNEETPGSGSDTPICTCGTEEGVHAESCDLYVAPADLVCSCGTEDGTHAESCPLYVAPADPVCSCGTEDGIHAESCDLYVAPADLVCSCGTEDGTHAESCSLYVAPVDPVCSCGTEDGIHAEGCDLYVAPAVPVCSCGTEDGTHTEGCPLYVTPAEPVPAEGSSHIDTCVEGCTGENCDCSCHELSLFDRLMACTTIEEMDAIFVATDDALLDALSDEQWEQIDAHFAEIAPAPIPALPTYDDAPVTSEIVYVTKNYDNVAPFVGDAD